jgi:hypothetical protein
MSEGVRARNGKYSVSCAYSLSSRIKPLLEMRLEALEHLFFNVFDATRFSVASRYFTRFRSGMPPKPAPIRRG